MRPITQCRAAAPLLFLAVLFRGAAVDAAAAAAAAAAVGPLEVAEAVGEGGGGLALACPEDSRLLGGRGELQR